MKRHIGADGVLPAGYVLPDEELYYDGQAIRWIAGGLDGVILVHGSWTNSDTNLAGQFNTAIARLLSEPGDDARSQLYSLALANRTLMVLSDVLNNLEKLSDEDKVKLIAEAAWLVDNAAHREVLKLGIALLALDTCPLQLDNLLVLGKHDEFAWYVARTLQTRFPDAEKHIFNLAKQVAGWGKIHYIMSLHAFDPDIKDWLIRFGCENDIMNEYLALACAEKGELHDVLGNEDIDREQYKGAGTILAALLERDGPAGDLFDLEDYQDVVSDYLKHSVWQAYELDDMLKIYKLYDFLQYWGNPENEAARPDFSPRWLDYALECCESLLSGILWTESIDKHLSDSGPGQYLAIEAARALGLDVWPRLYALLKDRPHDGRLYYELLQDPDPWRVEAVLGFGEKQISSTPPEADGVDDSTAVMQHIWLLQALPNRSGQFPRIVETGLKSPHPLVRSAAYGVIEHWQHADWPEGTEDYLKEMLHLESDRQYVAEIFHQQGRINLTEGKIEDAAICFQSVAEAGGNDASAWFNLGLCRQQLGQYQAAALCYSRGLLLQPDNQYALLYLGLIWEELGEYEQAASCLKDSLEMDPNQLEAWVALAWCLDCLGRNEEVIRCCQEALKYDSADGRFPLLITRCYNRLDNYPEALFWADRALLMNPGDPFIWYNKAYALMQMDRFEEAIRCFDHYLDEYPNDTRVISSKAFCLRSSGKPGEAIKSWIKIARLKFKRMLGK